MIELLTKEQAERYEQFCEFVKEHVHPFASEWEAKERIPRDVIDRAAAAGYLGGALPSKYGGSDWDAVTYGIFTEAVARASTSFSGLFNVHTMVMQTILKWGTEEQKDYWLPRMCRGEILAAFALTEPNAGSDIRRVSTKMSIDETHIIINGEKRWITFGGLADLYLVFGRSNDDANNEMACLVERNNPGLEVQSIPNMIGFKASQLAVLNFNNVAVSKNNMIAKPGFAFSHITPFALDYGRISVAFTALGMLKGCLEYSCGHALTRSAFNAKLIEQSSIKEMITKMGADFEAASHLCIHAVKAKDEHEPGSVEKVMLAKYFTTQAAREHAANAVQILGALGCHEAHPVARYYRDSKTLEIIEGSNQILERILGNSIARKNRNAGYPAAMFELVGV